MVKRRRLLGILAGTALLVPLRSRAQPAHQVRRIGFLAGRSRSTPFHRDPYYDAFVNEMRRLGYEEGKDLAIEWRFADGNYERLPRLALELAKLNVEVLVTHSSPGTRAAQRATRTIPLVMTAGGDPVGSGFAASLARPGGNITGLATMTTDMTSKQLELLKTLLPQVSRVAVLVNSANKETMPQSLKDIQRSAKQSGIEIVPIPARTASEIRGGFARMAPAERPGRQKMRPRR